MQKLIVTKFKDGQLIRKSTKKEGWGTMMVIETKFKFNNGIPNEIKRVAFLRGEIAKLQAFGLKEGDDLNATLSSLGHCGVKIVRKESTTPFFEGQQPKINPQNKAVVKDSAGNPIYLQDSIVDNTSAEEDELLESVSTASVVAEAGDQA